MKSLLREEISDEMKAKVFVFISAFISFAVFRAKHNHANMISMFMLSNCINPAYITDKVLNYFRFFRIDNKQTHYIHEKEENPCHFMQQEIKI